MSGPDIIGIIGIAIVLVCYFLVQMGRMRATEARYQLLNMAGCILILYSLYFDFNLPSVMIQIFWFLISAIGLIKGMLARRG